MTLGQRDPRFPRSSSRTRDSAKYTSASVDAETLVRRETFRRRSV